MNQIPDGDASMGELLRRAGTLPTGFTVGEGAVSPSAVLRVLGPLVSDNRARRIAEVVSGRCRSIAVVVEGLANSGNVAAVMRTAEGLGYLRFDIIAADIAYKHSARTTQGAEKWLDTRIWTSASGCAEALRQEGYRIVAAHLDESTVPIGQVDFSVPTALVFGNELGGVSPEMLRLADATCIIPMDGFVQSFNISVAAATALYHVREDRVRRLGGHGDLSPDDAEWLQAAYHYRSVAEAQAILERELAPE